MAKNTSKPTIATTPNHNPKLGDFLMVGGPSAKPSTGGRSTGGGVPQNRRGTSSGRRKGGK